MRRHAAAIGIIFLLTVGLYSRVSGAFFCGFDDFNEVHRAAFEDRIHPALMFTTSHFGTSKYRPINRLLTLLSYRAGGFSAIWFRLRNLFFHLLATAAVYGISMLLFDSFGAAFGGALLFAVSPLVNQNLTAAIFTNTTAYSLLLVSLFLFIYSSRAPQQRVLLLVPVFLLAAVALFAYESTIVLFGLIAMYLFLLRREEKHASSGAYTALLITGSLATAGIYLAARAVFVAQKSPLMPVSAVIRSTLAYTAALVSPIDPVFASYCCSLPLPPVIHLSPNLIAVLTVAAIAFLFCVFLLIRSPRARAAMSLICWRWIGWLLISAFTALLPFILFTDHISETYLYLPEAFWAVALTAALSRVFKQRAYAVIVIALVALFITSSWIRNERVVSCGRIARTILDDLPLSQWRTGSHRVSMAQCPGSPGLPHYGVYGYDGLSTIDPGTPGLGAAQSALQLATGNRALEAEVVSSDAALCPAGDECFCIRNDGQASRWDGALRTTAPRDR